MVPPIKLLLEQSDNRNLMVISNLTGPNCQHKQSATCKTNDIAGSAVSPFCHSTGGYRATRKTVEPSINPLHFIQPHHQAFFRFARSSRRVRRDLTKHCATNRADGVQCPIQHHRAAWCFACASASLIPAGLVSGRGSFCGCASGRKKE